MEGDQETAAILSELHAGRASAKERQTAVERQIREEARRLRQGDTGAMVAGAEAIAAGRQMLDFDTLAFAQGGHFMSNKTCNLPQVSRLAPCRCFLLPLAPLSPIVWSDCFWRRDLTEVQRKGTRKSTCQPSSPSRSKRTRRSGTRRTCQTGRSWHSRE